MSTFSGHLQLVVERRDDGVSAVAEQAFQAPFHLSKPYWDGQVLVVQVVNPTAGILSGDTLHSSVEARRGGALLLTTPSASRVFRMKEGLATSEQTFAVRGPGAWLEVSPEPLVLHAGSRFRQRTRVEVDGGGELLFADLLTPGRLARGECWVWDQLKLELEVVRDGALICRERLDTSGPDMARLAKLAGGQEGVCFANLVAVSEALGNGEGWRGAVEALQGGGIGVGVTPLRGPAGAWSIKILAPDGIRLRDTYQEVRRLLSDRLPKLAVQIRKQ